MGGNCQSIAYIYEALTLGSQYHCLTHHITALTPKDKVINKDSKTRRHYNPNLILDKHL